MNFIWFQFSICNWVFGFELEIIFDGVNQGLWKLGKFVLFGSAFRWFNVEIWIRNWFKVSWFIDLQVFLNIQKPNKTLKKLFLNLSRNPKKKPIFRNKKLFHIFFLYYLWHNGKCEFLCGIFRGVLMLKSLIIKQISSIKVCDAWQEEKQ
jgi:hypothetical protein